MSDNDRIAKVTLQYQVDRNSLNQVAQSASAVQAQINGIGTSTASITATAQTAGRSLQDAFAGLKPSIDDDINSIQSLRAEVLGTAGDVGKLNQSSSGSGGEGGGISGLRRSGAILNQFAPGAGVPLQLAGEATQLGKTFGDITDSMKGLTEAGGPATEIVNSLGGEMGVLAASGGLAVVAVGLLAVGISAYNEVTKSGKEVVENAVTQWEDYYKIIQTGTTTSIQADLDKRKQQQVTLEDQANSAKAALDKVNNPNSDIITDALTDIGTLTGYAKPIQDAYDKATKALTDNQNAIASDEQALKASQVAANNAAEAQNNYVKSLEANKAHAQELANLENTGTSKQIQDKIAANKAQIATDSELYASLSTITSPTKETSDEIKRLRDQMAQLAQDNKELTGTGLDLANARQAEIDATKAEAQYVKDLNKALADSQKASDDYKKSVQAESDAKQKNLDTIQKIEDTSNNARADLEQSYADKRVDIARKAVQSAQDELTKLQQKQEDLTTGLNRNLAADTVAEQSKLLDLQINFQRQQVSDTQDHLQKLQDIQRNAAQSDQDALLNRNFRQLFQNKQATSNAIDAENERYKKQEQSRIQTLNNQQQDELRAAGQQRQQRLIAYAQAEQDAKVTYQRQLQQDQLNKTRQLQEAAIANQRSENQLTVKLNRELVLQADSSAKQLALLAQTEAEKQKIFQDALNYVNRLSSTGQNVATSSGRSTAVLPFANGGVPDVGRPALVNEPGSSVAERFNGAAFPKSMGLFIPLQAGQIDPNRSGGGSASPKVGTINVPIYESSNPQATKKIVLGVFKEAGLM